VRSVSRAVSECVCCRCSCGLGAKFALRTVLTAYMIQSEVLYRSRARLGSYQTASSVRGMGEGILGRVPGWHRLPPTWLIHCHDSSRDGLCMPGV
jgi:hypothetical protein